MGNSLGQVTYFFNFWAP